MSARDQLNELGIRLRSYQPGEHRALCPECNRGKRDDALAVRIDDRGATWLCHRCCRRGAVSDRGHTERDQRPRPNPEPEKFTTLSSKGQALWRSCRPIEPGTVAAAYLEHRGCDIPPGDDLRWHPALTYYVDRQPVHVGPTLVALVTDVQTAEPISLHRTWISADGTAKADLDKPRRLLWKHRSDGVIRLWPDEEVTLGLTIGEGIETCLAAARAVIPRYTAAGLDPKRDIKVIFPPSEGHDAADLEAA
jgi:putative DNA primase/helicase